MSPRARRFFGCVLPLALLVGGCAVFLMLGYAGQVMFQVRPVDDEAMMPVLEPGMTVVVNNTAFWGRDPQRGAIVVLDSPDGQVFRRVVGLPGEAVAMSDNYLLVNGERQGLRITRGPGIPDWGPVQLGDDEFFVLAQNPAAADSRTWGAIARDALFGVGTFYYTETDRSWSVVDPTPTPARPSR